MHYSNKFIFVTLLSIIIFLPSYGQRGVIDSSFCEGLMYNELGSYISSDLDEYNIMNDAMVIGDDFYSIGVYGSFEVACLMLSKFSLDGIPDNDFDSDPDDFLDGTKVICADYFSSDIISISPVGLILDSDENFICPAYIKKNSNSTLGIIKLLKSGEVDDSYGINGLVEFPHGNLMVEDIYSYLIVEDQLYLSFSYYTNSTTLSFGVVNCDLNGNVNLDFGDSGMYIDPADNGYFKYIVSLETNGDDLYLISYDGELRANGTFIDHYRFLSLNFDGELNASFGTGGIVEGIGLNNEYTVLGGVYMDGYIYAILQSPYIDFQKTESFILRLDMNGDIDYDFGDSGFLKIEDKNRNTKYQAFSIQAIDDELFIFGEDNNQDNWLGYFAVVMNKEGVIQRDFGDQGFSKSYFQNYDLDLDEGDEYISMIHEIIPIPESKYGIMIGNAWELNGNFAFGKMQIKAEVSSVFEQAKNTLNTKVVYGEEGPMLQIDTKEFSCNEIIYKIFSSEGKVLQSKSIDPRNQNIVTNNLSANIGTSGSYYVSIYCQGVFVLTEKFVIFKR